MDTEDRAFPSEFLCPITMTLMSSPTAGLVGARRVTFERRAIERWRDECRARRRPFSDPTTNLPMPGPLEPDALRASMIRSYLTCASREEEAERLARFRPDGRRCVVYGARADALAAELHRAGCCDVGHRLKVWRAHRAAKSGADRVPSRGHSRWHASPRQSPAGNSGHGC
jgi:hypothetical protein